MDTQIIVAIIAACATILAAIIAGVFLLASKKGKKEDSQRIQGNGNIQAGNNVNISGGMTINAETSDRRK